MNGWLVDPGFARWAGCSSWPVPEPVGVGGAGGVEDGLAGGDDLGGSAGVDVGGVQVGDAGVVGVVVVPAGGAPRPRVGLFEGHKAVGVVAPVSAVLKLASEWGLSLLVRSLDRLRVTLRSSRSSAIMLPIICAPLRPAATILRPTVLGAHSEQLLCTCVEGGQGGGTTPGN